MAEEHFRKALSIGVHEQSVLALTPFRAVSPHVQNGSPEEARRLCKEGFTRSAELGEDEYAAKFRLISPCMTLAIRSILNFA
ncbi:hypothetical protein PO124_34245 [Bacillus licheniformis]|nr:hypothetical protein [Bacillus licheniformis]